MPGRHLIDRLPRRTIAWGRAYSVVAGGLDDADMFLSELTDGDGLEDLIELESMASSRIECTRRHLSRDPQGRPSGPFSSVVLDALSIQIERGNLTGQAFGGWMCHLSESDAIEEARARWSKFASASEASALTLSIQIFSASIGGNFVSSDEFKAYLDLSRSANDPTAVADEIDQLVRAGVDGILFSGAESVPGAAIVMRGAAITRVRPHARLDLCWNGCEAAVRTRGRTAAPVLLVDTVQRNA